jgi:hypothetical protein
MTQLNRHTLVAGLFAAVAMICLGTVPAQAAKSVTQFGITWTFDRDYPTGQFANGDYWVVGPVTITSITPKSTTSGSTTLHGSMINPRPNTVQGFDSRIQNNTFSASANVARSFPLRVPAGSSLLSSESFPKKAQGNDSQLKTIAILTVLAAPPKPGSFRPPYAGTDKRIRWNKSDLDYGRLRSLPKVRSAPSLSSVEKDFERPLIELRSNWTGGYLKPANNSPSYGREISHTVAKGLLSMNLDYSKAQKETTLVRLVQWGIDVYGSATQGMTWGNDGGHNHGRKPVLLFAGTMLNDPAILAYGDARKHFIFQEDQQTWYVSRYDVGRRLKTSDNQKRDPYSLEMIGLPEWGGKHTGEPEGDAANWDARYRTVCGASTVGTVLAARLMKLESKWNWPALFDYIDRYYQHEGKRAGGGTNSIQHFVNDMWKAYRGSTPSDFTVNNTSTDEVWQSVSIPTQTKAFTATFDLVPSKSDMEGITGLGSKAAQRAADLVTVIRFAPNGVIDALNGSTYAAANPLKYSAGKKYRVTMMVDPSSRRYSVNVTPPGGSPVRIANNWAFRTSQTSVSKLSHVSFTSARGAHSVLDVGVTPTSSTTSTTKPASTTPAAQPKSAPAPQPKAPVAIRINAGGKRYVDKSGQTWVADKSYVSGLTASTSNAIAGTNDDVLYQTERYDNTRSSTPTRYRIGTPNGKYKVRLHFAETHEPLFGAGKRTFDVKVEDKVAISRLDIFRRVGANRALTIDVTTTVTDGYLDIGFVRRTQNPTVSAIEVLPVK